MLGPILHGDKIRLAPFAPEHLDACRAWFADIEVTRYLLVRIPPSPKQEEEWYDRTCADNNQVVWGVFAGESIIGTTGLHQISWLHRHANSGTVIGDKSYWGQGIGSEVMRLRTDYAFQHLGLEKLSSSALAKNIGSQRCLERAGYTRIGVARRECFIEGEFLDAILYEILRDEWATSRGLA